MDAIGIAKAYIVGLSQGGAIALKFAPDYPEKVDKIVLVDSAGLGAKPPLIYSKKHCINSAALGSERDTDVDALTNRELQVGIVELDHAIYLHDQWYKKLLRVLISHVPPDPSDLSHDAHLRCHFGKWLESRSSIFSDDDLGRSSLKDAHKNLHSGARDLLQRVADGLMIPVDDWNHFENCREEMRLAILRTRHDFAETAKNRDPLTEIQTRAGLFTELRKQHALVIRGKHSCALAMLDLDHFKRINDSYGHSAGDTVLVSIVQCLKSFLRSYDRIYRYGGEEFIICMPSTTIDQAVEIMERLRSAISDLHFDFGDAQVTASFGLTLLNTYQPVEESINCADKAMYEAKATGRNRVALRLR